MTTEERQSIRAEEAEAIRKEEVIDAYENLLQRIWARTVTILGVVTLKAIVQRSVLLTAHDYPLLKNLAVTDGGLDFEALKTRVSEEEKATIKAGFEELILNLFDLLAKLTGEVIVSKLFGGVVELEALGTKET
jgi:hypothetical protein